MLRRKFIVVLAASTVLSASGLARTLEVGPQRDLKGPSDAAALANGGDSILIDPGIYTDCAIWRADNLTIEGEGDVTIRDRVCQDKAIFVISGSNVTIRAIEFAHARSSQRNGAGIRGEGTNLTIENSRFVDNENGILTGENPQSHIIIRDSVFTENGKCDLACAHGIYIGQIALLEVSNSTFFQQYTGHHIKSRALRTEITGNVIKDGAVGTASYEIDIPDGGSLVLRDNIIEKGPDAANIFAAVSIGEESDVNPTGELAIDRNTFINDNAATTTFVRNGTATTAQLSDNVIQGKVVLFTGPGQDSR
jgi:hypothetical protein